MITSTIVMLLLHAVHSASKADARFRRLDGMPVATGLLFGWTMCVAMVMSGTL